MRNSRSFFPRLMAGESGQALPWIAGICSLFMAIGGGLSVDLGRAYMVRSDLQNYANSMALAAAGDTYNTSSTDSSTAYANDYSATKGDENYNGALGTVTPTVTPICANLLEPSGTTCTSSSPSNAVKVSETTTINTFFMKLFGVPTLTITADATASMQGQAKPWNVAILIDATDSMASTDSNCSGLTEFHCAEQGIGTMLGSINPCVSGYSSCTPTSNSQFRVSLFQFPNASYNSNMYSTPCSISWSNVPYTLPTSSPTSSTGYSNITYTSSNGKSSYTGTYQVSNWSSTYYSPTSTSTSELNSTDPLVEEIGTTNSSTGAFSSGCLPDKGGESSYMAGGIYAATAALEAESAAVPNSQNAMIVLTDAQAQATSSDFPGAGYTASIDGVVQSVLNIVGQLLGTTNLEGGTVGTYPDYHDECQQMIVAAQAAKAAGIRVYSVAYGSEDSGCTSGTGGTDSALVLTSSQVNSLNYNFGAVTNLTPCVTMENVASSLQYFYSDYNQSGSGSTCQDASHTVVSLQDIFLAIAGTFTNPRLLPNNTSYVVTGS